MESLLPTQQDAATQTGPVALALHQIRQALADDDMEDAV
jgi:hypothetical protein